VLIHPFDDSNVFTPLCNNTRNNFLNFMFLVMKGKILNVKLASIPQIAPVAPSLTDMRILICSFAHFIQGVFSLLFLVIKREPACFSAFMFKYPALFRRRNTVYFLLSN
jgi:hypothetical protein